EVSLPVLVATLSTIIVLAPIALTPGLGGFLFKPLALAVAFAMIASYVLAFTVVPALCSRILKRHGHAPAVPTNGNRADGNGMGYLTGNGNGHDPRPPGIGAALAHRVQLILAAATRRYEGALRAAIGRRGLVLGGAAAALVGALLLAPT